MGLIKKGYVIEKEILYLKEQVQSTRQMEPEPIEEEVFTPGLEIPEIEIPETISEEELGSKKNEIIKLAKSEAEKIIGKAVDEAHAIKEQAKSDGLDEAKREAEETASEKVKEALGTLNAAVIERKKIIKDSESEILRLSLKVAEQIIKSEVSLHRDVCLNIVSDAINKVSDREQIIIKVNRDDLENIKKYKDRIMGVVGGVKSFSIVEDATVEAGGCVIETNLGYVDARISTKLAAIEEAFRKVQ